MEACHPPLLNLSITPHSCLVTSHGLKSKFHLSLSDSFPSATRVPLLCLQTVVGDVVRTLKVMYGSLDRSVRMSRGLAECAGLNFPFLPVIFLHLILPNGFYAFYMCIYIFFLLSRDTLNWICLSFLSAVLSAEWTTVPGWTIFSVCSSSSSYSHLAWGMAPQHHTLIFWGPFFLTDCRRSAGSRCLQKLRCELKWINSSNGLVVTEENTLLTICIFAWTLSQMFLYPLASFFKVAQKWFNTVLSLKYTGLISCTKPQQTWYKCNQTH